MVKFFCRKLLVAACFLLFYAASAQQVPAVQSFINPGIQSDIIDLKVHEGTKRFATLEVNGNMHVYDLQGRKLLASSATNEGETGEGSYNLVGAKNLMKFSSDGSKVAYFTVDAGFRLYDINTTAIIIEANWPDFKKTVRQLGREMEFTPAPDDIHFIGNRYLLYTYNATTALNNAFLFDLHMNKQVIFGKSNGFSIDELFWSEDSVPGFYINEEKDFQRIHINTGVEKFTGKGGSSNELLTIKDNQLMVSKSWIPVFTEEVTSTRTRAYSKDRKYLGYFTARSGFRLMNTETGELVIRLDWKNKFSNDDEDNDNDFDPEPDEVMFINDRYMLVLYDYESVNNNAFLFDLFSMKQVMVDGKYGFCMEEVLWSKDSVLAVDPLPMRKAEPVLLNVKSERFTIKREDTDNLVVINRSGMTISDDIESFSDSVPYPEQNDVANTSPVIKQKEYHVQNRVYQDPAWESIRKYYNDTLVVEWLTTDTVRNNVFAYYRFTNTTKNIYYHQGVEITELATGKDAGLYITSDIVDIGYSYLFKLAVPKEIDGKKHQDMVIVHPTKEKVKILHSFAGAGQFSTGTFISSADKKYIVFPQKVNKNYRQWFQLNVLSVNTGKLTTILEIPAAGVREYTEWIREDYKQLSRYAFLGNEYFIIQGDPNDLPVNTQLFETTNWSKLLEIPKKVVDTESFQMPLTTLFNSGDSLLLNNTNTWLYRDNVFADIIIPENADHDYQLIEGEDSWQSNFLKQYPIVSDELTERLYLYDSLYYDEEGNPKMLKGTEYLEPKFDTDKRRYFRHVKGKLMLEYYPHKSWTDFENSNAYADTALKQHIRFKAANGKTTILKSPYGSSMAFVKAAISKDDRYVFTGSNYNSIDIWNAEDGSYMATVMPNDKNGFLIINKDQYYYSTSGDNTRYLYVKLNGKVYPAEEVDAFLNRPDKVMESLDFINNPQLLDFYKAFYKQQQNLNGSDTMLLNHSRPMVDIDLNNVPLSTNSNRISFDYLVNSSLPLTKVYLWSNNIRIDSADVVLRDKKNNWQVLLEEGSNKLQVEVVNAEGLHSFKETFYVNYVPTEPVKYKMIGKVMAVSEYEKPSYNLKYAVKDARDMAAGLSVLASAKTDSLFNEDVNKDAFRTWKENLKQTNVDDIVVFYLAGHGALDKDGIFYFATSSTDLSEPGKNGISINELQNLFAGISARKRLLILDACHSGNAATLQMIKQFGSVQRASNESEGLTEIGRAHV